MHIDQEKILYTNMISSETPFKLAEIIRDTWPQLYTPIKKKYNKEKDHEPPKEL